MRALLEWLRPAWLATDSAETEAVIARSRAAQTRAAEAVAGAVAASEESRRVREANHFVEQIRRSWA